MHTVEKIDSNFRRIRIASGTGAQNCFDQGTFVKSKVVTVTWLHYDDVGVLSGLVDVQQSMKVTLQTHFNSFQSTKYVDITTKPALAGRPLAA